MGWLGRTLIGLIVIAGVGGGAYWWLVVDARPGTVTPFAIDIAEVRALADSMDGDRARSVHVEKIGAFSFPATAIAAGDGWTGMSMPVYSYQLVFPAGTGIVDTAMSKAALEEGGGSDFDADAYERMSGAIAAADFIVVTHEHFDHIGGLTGHPNIADIIDKVILSREQADHPEAMRGTAFPPGVLESAQPLSYDAYAAVAPGVVLIKAPGHTPGSQMVYVALDDGTEFIFLGDVAWQWRNVEAVKTRARLVSLMFLREDRPAVMGELIELNRLHTAEPEIHMVPGHDPQVVPALIDAGLMEKGFE